MEYGFSFFVFVALAKGVFSGIF